MNAPAQQVQAAQSKEVTLTQELDVLKPELAKVLPAHVSADKFMRVVMTAIAQTPALRDPAARRSLLTSCVKCATDGLVPDGREAALVMFKTKDGPAIQYMPMVSGILKKVRNSGELLSISSNVVHEKDHFRHWIDDAASTSRSSRTSATRTAAHCSVCSRSQRRKTAAYTWKSWAAARSSRFAT
jgi:phage RecT family recombinase